MIAEFGHFLLILVFVLSLLQGAGLLLSLSNGFFKWNAGFQFFSGLAAFFCLIWLYAVSDFSVLNVIQNSHSLKPFLYKITGVWGNHEGSMLLWVLILTFFGFLCAFSQKNMEKSFKNTVLSVQGLLVCGFSSFSLFTSNPFTRVIRPPVDGQDLNPLLQDPLLAIHPPLLYVGYVGFSIVFSFAIAGLVHQKVDREWARWVRPWVFLAWSGLTAGIALGSYWAYYELGWGGWWFWDPVENASLMPWLLGTALIHCIVVLQKREALKQWTLLLSILTFSLSMIGTFLVRSGVLNSVHSFALDPERGIYILVLLSLFTGWGLLLYALKFHKIKSNSLFHPLSREGALVLNNLLLATATATVFIGTLYPLMLTAMNGPEISVGLDFYNKTFLPLMSPLVFAMAIGPFLPWKRAVNKNIFNCLTTIFVIVVAIGFGTVIFFDDIPFLELGAMLLAFWLMVGTTLEIMRKDFKKLNFSDFGRAFAHFGLGVAILGMIGTGWWVKENLQMMAPGQKIEIGHFSFEFQGVEPIYGQNYTANRAHIRLYQNDQPLKTLHPERRFYPVAGTATTEIAIHTGLTNDFYVILGQQDTENPSNWVINVKTHPLLPLLWLGFLLIFLGGFSSLIHKTKSKKTS